MNHPLASLRCIVVCLLVALPAFAAPPAGEPTLPADEWTTIRKVIDDQLRALKAGDGAKAMSFAAPGIREKFGTPDNFLSMVREGYAPLLEARHTQFLEGALIEGAAIQPLRLVLADNTVLVALVPDAAAAGWKLAHRRLRIGSVDGAGYVISR